VLKVYRGGEMRRVAGVIAFVLVLLGLGGSSTGSGSVLQVPAKSAAELAIVAAYNGSRLAWLDPATLRPLKRASVALPGGAWSPVRSPAGQYVALGGVGSTGVRIVDVGRMKLTAQVARRSSQRYLRPLAWPTPRRLLVLDYAQNAQGAPEALLAIDPVSKKVVGRTVRASVAYAWTEWASAGQRLVLLSEPTDRLGRARLVVFGPEAGILRTGDVGIAGHWPDGPPQSQFAAPGLAVDPTGRSAYVVELQGVTRVDLETFDTSYAQLSESRSLLSRILGWIEPAAQAKLLAGFSRQATWLGEAQLAVSGAQYTGARSAPAGLQLVDAETGAARTLEPRASGHAVTGGLLLAFGAARDEQAQAETGMGLAAFTLDGTRLWSTLADEPVWLAETAGGYAYVPTPATTFPAGVRVVDLATGRALRTVRGELPAFVDRD
jgi:hypothetical protein